MHSFAPVFGSVVFYDVHDLERAIGVDLAGETYSRLIVEVDAGATPEDVAARIYGAIRQARVGP